LAVVFENNEDDLFIKKHFSNHLMNGLTSCFLFNFCFSTNQAFLVRHENKILKKCNALDYVLQVDHPLPTKTIFF